MSRNYSLKVGLLLYKEKIITLTKSSEMYYNRDREKGWNVIVDSK